MIEVTVNDDERAVRAGQTIGGVLEELGVADWILFVELNGELVHRDGFDDERVDDGDVLELIRVSGGG